ncbi:hypothetical protein GJ688_00760 [Heliobacillus mobilis]|uniref:TVP38/TMEM64 family membrane protein n=1 Tax=Heliobacterium mobile TaxID=28064 RepID=A0A6I3SAQ3_HELMO|nr:hypothetical protein [Heliobacterium mobile]
MRWSRRNLHWFILGTVVLAFAMVPTLRGYLFTAIRLMTDGDLAGLRAFILSFGFAAPLVSFSLMIVQAFLSPIPSVVLFLLNAAVFGSWGGLLLSWTSSLVSSLICFGLARRLGQTFVSKVVKEGLLARIDDYLYDYGSSAVLFSRLLPFMPFDVTSYAFGITRVTWWDFTWGTAVGQTPAIIFYTFLGHRMLDLWQYILYFGLWIFGLVILMPFFGNWLIRCRSPLNDDELAKYPPSPMTTTDKTSALIQAKSYWRGSKR